jgi:hypothetical protein
MKSKALLRLLLMMFFLRLTCSAQVLPPEIKQALDRATITEDGMLNGPDNCRDTLMEYMKRNWSLVLDNFASIAPKDAQKIILMRGAESLDAEDYLAFLTRLRDMRLSNTISQTVFDWIFTPSHYKEGFLEFNYQHPAIRDFVRSVRSLVNPDMQKALDDVLSGKSKKELEEEWQADHTGKVEPSLILPIRSYPRTQGAEASTPSNATNRSVTSLKSPTPSPLPELEASPTAGIKRTVASWKAVVGLVILIAILAIVWKRRIQ